MSFKKVLEHCVCPIDPNAIFILIRDWIWISIKGGRHIGCTEKTEIKSKVNDKYKAIPCSENKLLVWTKSNNEPVLTVEPIKIDNEIYGYDINANPTEPERVDIEIRGYNVRMNKHDVYSIFESDNELKILVNIITHELESYEKAASELLTQLLNVKLDYQALPKVLEKEMPKMFGVKRAYIFDLTRGTPVRIKFKDMYGLESAVPTLRNILESKMAEDKYCDAIVLSNTDNGSRITLVTCNTKEDITTFALDINDINNGKIELIELIPKEDSNE